MSVISRYLGMFSLDRSEPHTEEVLHRPVISRYLGMFSLDPISTDYTTAYTGYFPLSWDVLIRSVVTIPMKGRYFLVISRYLGMFSLDRWCKNY